MGPPLEIDPPPVGPAVNGLINSATVFNYDDPANFPEDNDDQIAAKRALRDRIYRFGNGLTYSPSKCDDATVHDPCATGATTFVKTPGRAAVRTHAAYLIDDFDVCSSFGYNEADYQARAIQALTNHESEAVEREFWTGTIFSGSPHLADGTQVSVPTGLLGTGLSPQVGLATLVQGLADRNAGRGMIHARPFLVEIWYGDHLIYREGNKLYTASGNIVVPGTGYPGTGPSAQAISGLTEWAFATDLVEIHRGPIEVFSPQPLSYYNTDHENNQVVVRAQRLVAPVFNGCSNVAVSITTPATGI